MSRPRLHAVNESFFDAIDSEIKAYWLGFLYADGHPAERALMLCLARQDGAHVARFKSDIGSEHSLHHTERKSAISICSTKLANKFRDMREECFIPKRNVHHFVRGVFDGDGCISKSSRGFFSVTIAANKTLAYAIKNIAASNGIAGGYIYKHSKPKTTTHVLHFTTIEGVCAIRDWMYKDATIFLERKKTLFDEAAPIMERACIRCGDLFPPRYSDKGAYCSRQCYMRDYYRQNRDIKWKENGVWKS